MKPLRDQVTVITGASSGIELCMAKLADAQEAPAVLSACTGEVLADIERQITADGGRPGTRR